MLSVTQLWVTVIISLRYNTFTSFQNVTTFACACLWSPGCKKKSRHELSHFLQVVIHCETQVLRLGVCADVSENL